MGICIFILTVYDISDLFLEKKFYIDVVRFGIILYMVYYKFIYVESYYFEKIEVDLGDFVFLDLMYIDFI